MSFLFNMWIVVVLRMRVILVGKLRSILKELIVGGCVLIILFNWVVSVFLKEDLSRVFLFLL